MIRLALRKELLLSCTVLLFTVSAGYSFYVLNRTSETIAEKYPLTAWLLHRTELEFNELLHSLELYNAGAQSGYQVKQDFDILWNRADVIIKSQEALYARKNLDVVPLIRGLQEEMEAIDYRIQMLPDDGSNGDGQLILSRLIKFKPELQALHLRSFHHRDDLYNLTNFSNALSATGLAFGGLLISGLLLIILLIRQYRFSHHHASHDNLSGLTNRRTFIEQLERTLKGAEKGRVSFAVYLIDLDNFKQINDSYGHLAGDELIRIVGGRLRHSLRQDDLAARLGGDEFALIQYPVRTTDDCDALRNRIAQQLSLPVNFGEHQITMGFSIGISHFPQDGDNAEALLHHADLRMYEDKATHRPAHITASSRKTVTFD